MELTVDGRKVFAATGGRSIDPTLPAIVFVHGAAMDHTVWALQARYFAHRGRAALAIDLPGCGRSDGPVLDSVEECGAWLVRLLDAAELGQAALVGHSLGASITLEAAAQAPDRISRMALLGAAAPMAINESFVDAARRNDHLAIELMNDWAHGQAAHIGGCKIPGRWIIGGDTRLIERAKPDVLYRCLKISRDYAGGPSAASKVRCPVLLVAGDRDRMTSIKNAQDLAGQLADAELAVLADCGHIMMIERPDELLGELKTRLLR